MASTTSPPDPPIYSPTETLVPTGVTALGPDLTKLLDDWPYEPGQINVRVIEGDDGAPRLQMRLDLGIIQMHLDGRPDGQRPHGFESYLEAFEHRLDEVQTGLPDDPEAEPIGISLSPDECRMLREEAAQYYHRYLALLVLEDYERVIRDTTRNIRSLDLCAKYAEMEADRSAMEQFRSYITMMRARAMASQAMKDNEPKAAILAIDEGLEAMRAHFDQIGRDGAFDESPEVQMLRAMRDSLVPKLPVSQKAELRQRLQSALAQENYELAAILRDELKMMPD